MKSNLLKEDKLYNIYCIMNNQDQYKENELTFTSVFKHRSLVTFKFLGVVYI